MRLVRVKNFPNRIAAERAQQTLREQGIESVIQSLDAGVLGAGGAAGFPQGADLFVQEEHAATARELLESLFDGI